MANNFNYVPFIKTASHIVEERALTIDARI